MARRRMLSLTVINSARFLKMPPSTQNLYFHLNIRADDDGIVEGFSTMRMTGATEDDLKILDAKDFIEILNEDLVTYIKDWKEHNLIRADRKIDSVYKDLLLQILPETKLIETRERADRKHGTSTGQPKDSIGKVSIGKVRKVQDSIKKKTTFKKPTIEEIKKYCKERNNKIDAETFYHYYESKNWMVGKNKMKAWKSAVITWEKRETKDGINYAKYDNY